MSDPTWLAVALALNGLAAVAFFQLVCRGSLDRSRRPTADESRERVPARAPRG